MHMNAPLPESQLTDVFIFLAAVQSCHSVTTNVVTLTIQYKTRQITIKYSLQKELTKTKHDKTKKKSANWYITKTSPLLPTAEKKNPCDGSRGMWNYSRYFKIHILPFLVEPGFKNTAKFYLYKGEHHFLTV